MRFVIQEDANGLCIRQFIKERLQISVKMLKHLKYRTDGICVNGERRTVRYLLHTGDVLTLAVEDRENLHAHAAVELPLEILYEDDDLVVPLKPANMPTHPSHDHYRDTVANALTYRYQQEGIPFVFRPINRLDRNTSGLLLIARNKMAAGYLSDAMKAGEIRKSYLAILDGELTEPEGEINACLHRTAASIIVREVCSPDAPDAAPSVTRYRVLAVQNGHTLVEAFPLTGRTHQLRVHFAHLGHPITGDDLYGTPSDQIGRHALHARTLTFPLPSTGEPLTVTAPLTRDFAALLKHCFPEHSLTHERTASL